MRLDVTRFLSHEIFDSLSDYIITGKQLCGRVMGVTAFGYHIMGFPLCIENEKARHHKQHTTCFLEEGSEDASSKTPDVLLGSSSHAKRPPNTPALIP
jgi:hypothetical protein